MIMRCLIDTNIFIRLIKEPDLISENVRSLIFDNENQIFISSESVKEFIHLVQTGKIAGRNKKQNLSLDIFNIIENELGYSIRYVSKEHLNTFAKLDLLDGHNDPSDRLIIAQAITEKMLLISSDSKFPKYRKQGLELIVNR